MKYDEQEVERIYQENLSRACALLASLPVAGDRKPTTKGLNGRVYEQTVRYCLCEELKELALAPAVDEQVRLYGRTKVDLLVGRVAIEIKALGIVGKNARKYSGYRAKAEENGWSYFYLTRGESYGPYRVLMQSIFGKERAFFLDTLGDWERFVKGLEEILKR
jgi:hypothetical protein